MRTADMLKELYGEFGNVAEQYRTGNRYEVTDLTRAGVIISVIMNQMKVGKRDVIYGDANTEVYVLDSLSRDIKFVLDCTNPKLRETVYQLARLQSSFSECR